MAKSQTWAGLEIVKVVPYDHMYTKIHWQKTFATFSLGSSLQLLVANLKKYPCKIHWQRGYLGLAMAVRLG